MQVSIFVETSGLGRQHGQLSLAGSLQLTLMTSLIHPVFQPEGKKTKQSKAEAEVVVSCLSSTSLYIDYCITSY
jgi:hypothetical protein